jgi:hypothetical protein
MAMSDLGSAVEPKTSWCATSRRLSLSPSLLLGHRRHEVLANGIVSDGTVAVTTTARGAGKPGMYFSTILWPPDIYGQRIDL